MTERLSISKSNSLNFYRLIISLIIITLFPTTAFSHKIDISEKTNNLRREIYDKIEKLENSISELKQSYDTLSKIIAEADPQPEDELISTSNNLEEPEIKEEEHSLFPDDDKKYDQAFRLMQQGKLIEAKILFESFVEEFPGSPLTPPALKWIGELYFQDKNYSRAVYYFIQSQQLSNDEHTSASSSVGALKSLKASGRESEMCQIFSKLNNNYSDLTKEAKKLMQGIKCK